VSVRDELKRQLASHGLPAGVFRIVRGARQTKPKRPANRPQLQKRDDMIRFFTAKRIFLVFILLSLTGIPLTSQADCGVTLQWDTSDQAQVLEGYQVFGREEGQDYDYDVPWWQGDSTFNQCTIDSLDENKTYFFVVRAFAGDNMSTDSNEVRYAASDNANGSTVSGQSSTGCFIQSLFQS
jgi:hypothetical protein